MSLEEKKTIQEAFEVYNTKRLKLITDTFHTIKEKEIIKNKLYDEYLKWYKTYRKQLDEAREAKRKAIKEAKKNGILEKLH